MGSLIVRLGHAGIVSLCPAAIDAQQTTLDGFSKIADLVTNPALVHAMAYLKDQEPPSASATPSRTPKPTPGVILGAHQPLCRACP